jgi:hypothetical protein
LWGAALRRSRVGQALVTAACPTIVYWPNLLALVACLAATMAKRLPDRYNLAQHGAIIVWAA